MLVSGDTEELQPLLQLATAPYAAFSQSCGDADTLGGKSGSAFMPATPTAGSIAWTSLTGVPNGLGDGDDNTQYSAGAGLSLTGTTFSVNQAIGDARYAALSHTHAGSEITSGTVPSARVDAYTKSASDARFARMTGCYWKYNPCGTNSTCTVDCNAGDYAVSGGCDANYGAGDIFLVESFPGPSAGYGTDANGPWHVGAVAPLTVVDRWSCRVKTGNKIDNAYVFCCPDI